MRKKRVGTALAAAVFAFLLPASGLAQTVDELVARNVAARGGAKAWKAVSSLRLTGRMDVGKGTMVPYLLEQKRPGKMRLEFVFDGKTAVESTDGKTGWKIRPFLNRTAPEPMTGKELSETADTADLYGLLFEHAGRGHAVELLGRETVEGRDAYKLKVTLPRGSVRWVYLDTESGLEIKVETLRTLRGKDRRVETFYRDWKKEGGLLVAHRQETRTEGEKKFHLLTVEKVLVNPPIEDSRFAMPAAAAAGSGRGN
jgi:outer membrane lipoprotein-sorting protein